MFTGLVEMTGRISDRRAGTLIISPQSRLVNPVIGESIAVNGCCLTLERETASGELVFHTMAESLRRTNLGMLAIGSKVNLERALASGARLGGHIVQGHVDRASEVLELKRLPDGDMELLVAMPAEDAALVVEKGSVALDGVSLTVVEAENDFFGVRLIPVTLAETALAARGRGALINVEYDIIGRYVIRQLEVANNSRRSGGEITMDTLRDAGFF